MSEDVPEQLPNQAPAVDAEWWPAAPVAADEQAATVEPEPPVVEPAPPTVEPAPPTVEPAAAVADATPVPEAAGPAPPAWRPPWATWGRAPADGVPETAHEDPAPAESPEVDPVLAAVTMALGAEPPIPSSLRPDVDIDFDVQWAPEVLAEAETPVTEPSPAEDVPADAPVDAAAAIVVANGVDAQPVRAARRPAPFQWGPGEDHWPPVPSKSPPSPPPPDPPPPAVPLTPRETPDELWDLAGYGKEPADHLDRPRHPRVAALTARWAAKTRGQKVNVVLYALTGVSI
ncbi:MAG: hypothetical protein QOE93_519, partial [Actinomycetota bacterium]|nr:hypothetical protein [Actinomycetota bacterium]